MCSFGNTKLDKILPIVYVLTLNGQEGYTDQPERRGYPAVICRYVSHFVNPYNYNLFFEKLTVSNEQCIFNMET